MIKITKEMEQFNAWTVKHCWPADLTPSIGDLGVIEYKDIDTLAAFTMWAYTREYGHD